MQPEIELQNSNGITQGFIFQSGWKAQKPEQIIHKSNSTLLDQGCQKRLPPISIAPLKHTGSTHTISSFRTATPFGLP